MRLSPGSAHSIRGMLCLELNPQGLRAPCTRNFSIAQATRLSTCDGRWDSLGTSYPLCGIEVSQSEEEGGDDGLEGVELAVATEEHWDDILTVLTVLHLLTGLEWGAVATGRSVGKRWRGLNFPGGADDHP